MNNWFNVGLQCSSVFAVRGGQVQYLDELQGFPDTDMLARAIIGRYWPKYEKTRVKPCKISLYPDPTGKSRKTSAVMGRTDFNILGSYGFRVFSHNKSPPIVDSVNAVNRMLKTAAGEINLFFHPRCTGTIMSIERTSWLDNNPDSATIDKKEGVEHFSDGVRYSIEYLFSIRSSSIPAVRGFGF